jgi:hypothetical protein
VTFIKKKIEDLFIWIELRNKHLEIRGLFQEHLFIHLITYCACAYYMLGTVLAAGQQSRNVPTLMEFRDE